MVDKTEAIEKTGTAKRSFFNKAKRTVGKIPFVPDVVSMYYCMMDPATPTWAKGAIAGGLVYFVFPIDLIPDLLGIVGYVDDGAVIGAVLTMISKHLTVEHRRKAKEWLES